MRLGLCVWCDSGLLIWLGLWWWEFWVLVVFAIPIVLGLDFGCGYVFVRADWLVNAVKAVVCW